MNMYRGSDSYAETQGKWFTDTGAFRYPRAREFYYDWDRKKVYQAGSGLNKERYIMREVPVEKSNETFVTDLAVKLYRMMPYSKWNYSLDEIRGMLATAFLAAEKDVPQGLEMSRLVEKWGDRFREERSADKWYQETSKEAHLHGYKLVKIEGED